MTSKTAPTSPEQQREFLAQLGLNPDAPDLLPTTTAEAPAKPKKAKVETDLRSIPASEIVFDPADLDQFADLNGSNMAAASRFLFEKYKSPRKDSERHGLLHRRIGEFIQQTRRARQQLEQPVGQVKEKVKASKEQRDLAAMIAEHGITTEDLARLLKERG